MQKVCPQSDTQSLKMHCTTKQEKCRKLQPGESQKYPFTISQHLLNPSTKSSLFLMRLGFYMLRSWLCSPLWISDTGTISSQWLHSPILPTQVPQGRTKKRIFGADSRRSRSWMILDRSGQQSSIEQCSSVLFMQLHCDHILKCHQ